VEAPDRLRRRFDITRVCVVADRGMISAETMAELEARRLLYILGVRERTDKLVRELVLDDPAPFVPLVMKKRVMTAPAEARHRDFAAKPRTQPRFAAPQVLPTRRRTRFSAPAAMSPFRRPFARGMPVPQPKDEINPMNLRDRRHRRQVGRHQVEDGSRHRPRLVRRRRVPRRQQPRRARHRRQASPCSLCRARTRLRQ
jgi:hypothetical protein